MLFKSVLCALAGATAVSAIAIERAEITDFKKSPVQFYYPPGREGFTAENADDAPCGNAPPTNPRTPYPINGGQISLIQRGDIDDMSVLWTKGAEPTRFHQFATYGLNTVTDIGAGHYCTVGPDFGSLGLSAGDDATLLIIYKLDGQTSKGYFYQCADVTLVDQSAWVKPDRFMCGNYTMGDIKVASSEDSLKLTGNEGASGLKMPDDDAHANVNNKDSSSSSSSSTDAAASAAGSSSKLTNAGAGGIGAGVTIFVVLALLGTLYAAGRLHFGKRNVTLDDGASSTSSTAYAVKQVQQQ